MPTDKIASPLSPTRSSGHTPPGVPSPILPDTHYAKHRRQLRSGSRLGRYVIDGVLGRGGMGVVFGAVDTKLGRRAAIKVVSGPAYAGRSVRHGHQRLLREAQALARIDHPNIVSLYDVGEAPGGMYIAMEELHGVSLKSWLVQETRSWRETLAVFLQAGRGLAAAHRAGVVHRDFKPTNVHILEDGRVVVLDFGLALATEDLQVDPSASGTDLVLGNRLTEAGIVLGTTGYMSPEQLLRNEAGPRSDQFAFCVALFEALLGARPYPGENAIEAARAFRAGERAPRPRTRIPRRLLRVIERGLAIDADARWPSMEALLRELERDPNRRLRDLSRTAVLVSAAWAGAYGAMWAHGVLKARAAAPLCAPVETTAPLAVRPTPLPRD